MKSKIKNWVIEFNSPFPQVTLEASWGVSASILLKYSFSIYTVIRLTPSENVNNNERNTPNDNLNYHNNNLHIGDNLNNIRLPRPFSTNQNAQNELTTTNRNLITQNLTNGTQEELSLEETNRRRLYLNLGRPRPFYREQMTRYFDQFISYIISQKESYNNSFLTSNILKV